MQKMGVVDNLGTKKSVDLQVIRKKTRLWVTSFLLGVGMSDSMYSERLLLVSILFASLYDF